MLRRFTIPAICCVLLVHLASCDFVFGDDTIDGTWKGNVPIGENSIEVELEITQTLLYRRLNQVTGTGRYTYVEAGLSVLCTIEGEYIVSIVTLDLKANGFAPISIEGKVTNRRHVIEGHYIVLGQALPITLHRE